MSSLSVWRKGAFLQVCFPSVGCRFKRAGYCTFCNYGADKNISATEAAAELNKVLKDELFSDGGPITELLLGTYGSILDTCEISRDCLTSILNIVSQYDIPSIIFETHYVTINDRILQFIKSKLPDKEIVIEMGLESFNPNVLKHSLNKYMNLNDLCRVMKIIKAHGMFPILNVFLGAPYLTYQEQIEDVIQTSRWAVDHGANRVVIFPANPKPNTLLWDLLQRGEYKQVTHRQIVETLNGLPDYVLIKTELSWYGERQEAGYALEALPPIIQPRHKEEIFKFYNKFQNTFEVSHRRYLINNILKYCRKFDL